MDVSVNKCQRHLFATGRVRERLHARSQFVRIFAKLGNEAGTLGTRRAPPSKLVTKTHLRHNRPTTCQFWAPLSIQSSAFLSFWLIQVPRKGAYNWQIIYNSSRKLERRVTLEPITLEMIV